MFAAFEKLSVTYIETVLQPQSLRPVSIQGFIMTNAVCKKHLIITNDDSTTGEALVSKISLLSVEEKKKQSPELISLITLPVLESGSEMNIESSSKNLLTSVQNVLADEINRIRKDVNNEKKEMQESFQRERLAIKEELTRVFADEIKAIKDGNDAVMMEIVKGMNALKEKMEKANVEIEAKFAAEFAREVSKQLNVAQPATPAKTNDKPLKSMKDLGSYLSVADKR